VLPDYYRWVLCMVKQLCLFSVVIFFVIILLYCFYLLKERTKKVLTFFFNLSCFGNG